MKMIFGRTAFIPGFCAFLLYRNTFGVSPLAATQCHSRLLGKAHWGGVPPRNVNFTGREELLRQLHERLEPGVMTAVVPHALRGLGGVGKTQLAAEYAYRHRADFDMIWWIPAEDPVQIQVALVELGQRISLDIPSDVNVAVSVVMDALEGNARSHRRVPPNWLLIFDNAEHPQDVLAYLPSGAAGRILITSRNSQWLNLARLIEVAYSSGRKASSCCSAGIRTSATRTCLDHWIIRSRLPQRGVCHWTG